MSMTINTNLASLNAQRNLSTSQNSMMTSLQRLSSGLRINSAKDDAAGLSIADRMGAQIRGLSMAQRNTADAVSLLQVADGGTSQIADNLQRMRELAVQAKNGALASTDRANLQEEFNQLQLEITRVAGSTKFNNIQLINSAAGDITFQIGAGTAGSDTLTVTLKDLQASATGMDVGSTISISGSTGSNAGAAIDAIDTAIDNISTQRATYGANLNRLDAITSNLQSAIENQKAARGRIMDADFAVETSNMTRSQILQQAGTAMLAQANALPQNVLTLLR